MEESKSFYWTLHTISRLLNDNITCKDHIVLLDMLSLKIKWTEGELNVSKLRIGSIKFATDPYVFFKLCHLIDFSLSLSIAIAAN